MLRRVLFFPTTTTQLCSQINDRTNEARMLCDLCIIQLNVAYNFKRQANKTAIEMEQCLIEMGLSEERPAMPATTTTSSSTTTTTVVVPPAEEKRGGAVEATDNNDTALLRVSISETLTSSTESVVVGTSPTIPTPSSSTTTTATAELLLVPKIEPFDNNASSSPHTGRTDEGLQYHPHKRTRTRRGGGDTDADSGINTPATQLSSSRTRNSNASSSERYSFANSSRERSSRQQHNRQSSPSSSALAMAVVHVNDGKTFNLHDSRSDMDFINAFMPSAGRKSRRGGSGATSTSDDVPNKRHFRRMCRTDLSQRPATRGSRSNSGCGVSETVNLRKRPPALAASTTAVKRHHHDRR